jgi:VanZ family protein
MCFHDLPSSVRVRSTADNEKKYAPNPSSAQSARAGQNLSLLNLLFKIKHLHHTLKMNLATHISRSTFGTLAVVASLCLWLGTAMAAHRHTGGAGRLR